MTSYKEKEKGSNDFSFSQNRRLLNGEEERETYMLANTRIRKGILPDNLICASTS